MPLGSPSTKPTNSMRSKINYWRTIERYRHVSTFPVLLLSFRVFFHRFLFVTHLQKRIKASFCSNPPLNLASILCVSPEPNPRVASLHHNAFVEKENETKRKLSDIASSFRLLHGLDLGESGGELAPVIHDKDGTSVLEDLGHLGLLVSGVGAGVAEDLDTGAETRRGTALGVLNSNALLGLLAEHLHGVNVDGGVRLGGRSGQRGGGREDVVLGEVLGLVDLLDGGENSALGRGGDDGKLVLALSLELVELLHDTDARATLSLDLGNDGILLSGNVVLKLLGGELDSVALLEGAKHAAEVLANELRDQRLASEGLVNLLTLADAIDNLGASSESELLGENEGVVAVEEKGGDLQPTHSLVSFPSS